MRARVIRMLPGAAPAPVVQDLPAPDAPDSEVADLLRENNMLLRQMLTELRIKKKWSFVIAKDQLGRPMQVDATQQ